MMHNGIPDLPVWQRVLAALCWLTLPLTGLGLGLLLRGC